MKYSKYISASAIKKHPFHFCFLLLILFTGQTCALSHINTFPEVADDESMQAEREMMRLMTRKEHPLARMERIAHDYVYAESGLGYKDPQLLRRMKADGLILVKAVEDDDRTAAIVVRDDKAGKHIIVFRGTDDKKDNQQNLDEVMSNRPVSMQQYLQHRWIWKDWAKKYARNGKIAVTGHSRGGDLAALFASEYSGKIDQITLFQSPGQFLADHKRFRRKPNFSTICFPKHSGRSMKPTSQPTTP